jgi:hypothetical protein
LLANLPEALERENIRLVKEILETANSGDEDITSSLKFLTLETNWTTSVGDTRSKHSSIA